MTGLTTRARSRLGVTLVLVGVVMNPWLVGHLSSDGLIDRIDRFAAILFVEVGCILGGLQLLWRWVERLSWGREVGFIRGSVVVGLFAFTAAGAYWGVTNYRLGHSHTTLVPSEQQVATAEQQQWARDFYQRSLAAALKHGWFDFDAAMAQGFQVDPVNGNHYPNPQYIFDDVILDPERPEWLVYDQTPTGKVLMALMFFTRRLEDVGPTPGGPLAQWHYHPYERPRCAIEGLWTIGYPDDNGRCAKGIPVMRTPEMFHIWFIDHPLGRYTEMKIVPEYFQEEGFDYRRMHPMVVHFAIALFIIAVLLDLLAVVTARGEYHRMAWVNLAFAAVAAVAAVGTGMTAEVLLKPTHETHQALDVHKLLGFSSVGGILLLSVWRFALRGNFPQRSALLYIAVSLASIGAVAGTGYYGGEMVYRHGAGVQAIDRFARERYWREVQEVYRNQPAEVVDHSGHQ